MFATFDIHVNDGSELGSVTPLLDALIAIYTSTMVCLTGLTQGYVIPNYIFLLTLALFLFELLRGRVRIRLSVVSICFLLVAVGSFLPVVFGKATNNVLAVEHVIRSAQMFLMVVVYDCYLTTKARILLVIKSACLGFLGSFVVGHLILHLSLGGRAVGLYQNPNSAAFWAMFSLLSLICHFLLTRFLDHKPISRVFFIAVSSAAFWLIWASQSRKVLLAIMLPLAALLFRYIRRSHFSPIVLAISFVLLFSSLSVLANSMSDRNKERWLSTISSIYTGNITEHAFLNRIEFYRTGYEILKESPILGRGGGSFFILGRERSATIERNVDTHSVFLDVYIESGLLGIVSYLFLFAFLIHRFSTIGIPTIFKALLSASVLSILAIQLGGSIQLDKYMWLTITIMNSSVLVFVSKTASSLDHEQTVVINLPYQLS